MNTTQPNLFGTDAYGGAEVAPVRAHRADPATSHEAAERVAASGRAQRHMAIALALVTRFHGQTGYELFRLASDEERADLVDHFEVYRKLACLKNAGKVRHGPARICEVRGVKMVTWELT